MNQRSASTRSDESDRMESLKAENLHLKKELSSYRTDNHKLKVKVRKLQDDLNKSQKQIYNLVDPKKSSAVRKFIVEHGATLFLNLKEQKDQLIKGLMEKESQIKKLHCELQTAKLYMTSDRRKLWAEEKVSKQFSLENEFELQDTKFKSVSLSEFNKGKSNSLNVEFRPKSSLDLAKSLYGDTNELQQLSNNLLKIKLNAKLSGIDKSQTPLESKRSGYSTPSEKVNSAYSSREASPNRIIQRRNSFILPKSLKSPKKRSPERANDSPQSDIDRIEVGCETPHEDIQQLQTYFLEMLDEVGSLRSTINQLQKDQKKTNIVLKDKEEYIEELAEEINCLKTKTLVPPRPTIIKKKKSKRSAYDRKSTSSLMSHNSYERMCKEKDHLDMIQNYLYKGRYHGQEFDLQTESNTAIATHCKNHDVLSKQTKRKF